MLIKTLNNRNPECPICYPNFTGTNPCSTCLPDTCLNCHASHVSYHPDNNTLRCSHGCEYSPQEYRVQALYTIFLNGTPTEKLSHAGTELELLYTEPETITVTDTIPTPEPGYIRGIHHTPNATALVQNGYDPNHADKSDHYTLPERASSAYAWPYPLSHYVHDRFADNPNNEHVYFKAPTDTVRISSYTILMYIHNTNTDEPREYTIPDTKYWEHLTFTIDELATAINTESCPLSNSDFFPTIQIATHNP